MSVLYDSLKREFVIDRLQALGVTKSQQGKDINDIDYDTLKYELVLAEFHAIDVENDQNRWF